MLAIVQNDLLFAGLVAGILTAIVGVSYAKRELKKRHEMSREDLLRRCRGERS